MSGTHDPPLDLFDGLTGDLAEQLIREELPDTALFGLRFRQNAARALLMPRPDPSKRTPFAWSNVFVVWYAPHPAPSRRLR